MQISEVAVVRAARERATRNGKIEAHAAIEAADAIGKIRSKFTGDQYQRALEKLYQQYAS